jgi:hypothetical protein
MLERARAYVSANIALIAVWVMPVGVSAVEERTSGVSQIYQQRNADGSVLLTDRPVAGAATLRVWQISAEDVVAASERRQRARAEASAVSERIQHQIDSEQQREHEIALARLQLARAETSLAAERARADPTAQRSALFVSDMARRPFPKPPRVPRPGPPRPRLAAQPGV